MMAINFLNFDKIVRNIHYHRRDIALKPAQNVISHRIAWLLALVSIVKVSFHSDRLVTGGGWGPGPRSP